MMKTAITLIIFFVVSRILLRNLRYYSKHQWQYHFIFATWGLLSGYLLQTFFN
jgi:hypothetical protein